jgi:hypothetical protein
VYPGLFGFGGVAGEQRLGLAARAAKVRVQNAQSRLKIGYQCILAWWEESVKSRGRAQGGREAGEELEMRKRECLLCGDARWGSCARRVRAAGARGTWARGVRAGVRAWGVTAKKGRTYRRWLSSEAGNILGCQFGLQLPTRWARVGALCIFEHGILQ